MVSHLTLLAVFVSYALVNAAVLYPPLTVTKITLPSKCSSFPERIDFRDMTALQWQTYTKAVNRLRTPVTKNGIKYASVMDSLVKIHYDASGNWDHDIHQTPRFLPWHRAFILLFEANLKATLTAAEKKNFVFPYWDWTYDWHSPNTVAPLADPKHFMYTKPGTNDPKFVNRVPDEHGIRRAIELTRPGFTNLWDPATVRGFICRQREFDSAAATIEFTYHGNLHDPFGGENGDLRGMESPGDPWFWLFHPQLDCLLMQWQYLDPTKRSKDYSAGENIKEKLLGGVTVADMLNLNRLCYKCRAYSKNSAMTQAAWLSEYRSPTFAGASDGTVVNVSACKPRPLSNEWLRMNGHNATRVRKIEADLAKLQATLITQQQCDASTQPFLDHTTAPILIPDYVPYDSVPAWAIAVLVLGSILFVAFLILIIVLAKNVV